MTSVSAIASSRDRKEVTATVVDSPRLSRDLLVQVALLVFLS
jgi:hypothetical protein